MRVWLNLRRNAFSEVFENYFFDSITFSFRSLHPRLPFISLSHPLALCLLFPISLFHTIFLSAMSLFFSHSLSFTHNSLSQIVSHSHSLPLCFFYSYLSFFTFYFVELCNKYRSLYMYYDIVNIWNNGISRRTSQVLSVWLWFAL